MEYENETGKDAPNILIVDDVPANLKVLNNILQDNGYKVRPVLSGDTALQVAEKEKPDLVLLDIMMPDMNGYEVCRRFKENKILGDIPIIFISALTDTDDIVKAFSSGGVDYITKPFRAEEVSARVATHLMLHQQKKELQVLNSAKDKFFSIIAHDLKSPFNAIIGFSELLREQVREKDFDGIEEYTTIIFQSSKRAMELLTNLMEWSRSQTGRMDYNPDYFEIVGLINGITPLFDDIAGQKSITIRKELPNNVIVFADQAMLSTILRNLVSNAIKFSLPGGQIVISVEKGLNGLTVSVKDSGIGIPQERIDKLFSLDKSCSTLGTNSEQGTGLGLILCKEFVIKHSGNIWVESGVGKGSTFYVTLPVGIFLNT